MKVRDISIVLETGSKPSSVYFSNAEIELKDDALFVKKERASGIISAMYPLKEIVKFTVNTGVTNWEALCSKSRAKTQIEELKKDVADLEQALDILKKEHEQAHSPLKQEDEKEKTEAEMIRELYFYVIKNVVGRNESMVFLDEPTNYVFVFTDRHDKVFRYLIPKGTKIDIKKESNKMFEAWRFGKMTI